jgi:hypothetical protein
MKTAATAPAKNPNEKITQNLEVNLKTKTSFTAGANEVSAGEGLKSGSRRAAPAEGRTKA